jgi:glutathione S-transferase
MVPSGLVPAVLFHGDDSNNTSRNLVWESDAILYALDEMFPDTPRLMKNNIEDVDDEFDAAMEMQDRVQAAGFKFAYAGRNETSTEDEKQKIRNDFESALDELDSAFGEQRQKLKNPDDDGCFRLGSEFSGIDAMMIPTLERWRYQLPLTENLDILENRIHLTKYFEHLDSFSPYSDRVAGDKYSWTATASTFLRYFGGGEDKPEVAAKIKRADAAAKELEKEFINVNYQINYEEDEGEGEDDRLFELLVKAAAAKESTNEKELSTESIINNNRNNKISDERLFALEAVTKLITNHEAVVSDCVRDEPLSQKHIPRGSDRDTADLLLRHVASVLLQTASLSLKPIIDNVAAVVKDGPSRTQGALALKAVATRLCVPRDMGAPSAALLREVLCIVAEDLLDESVADEEVQTVSTPTVDTSAAPVS